MPPEYDAIAGEWPQDVSTVKDFLEALGLDLKPAGKFQLHQTFSACSLEEFNPDTKLDFDHLEQHRCFGPDWELWIRQAEFGRVRFRFLAGKGVVNPDWEANLQAKNFSLAQFEALAAIEPVEKSYLLSGEPLNQDGRQGWYTGRLPQIITYPVSFPAPAKLKGARVVLVADNFVRLDGTVELVRYKTLELITV